MAVIARSRRAARTPLSRSRSGDGLLRVGRRNPKHKCACWPIMTFFMALVVLVVVATVQSTFQGNPGSIRKRQLRQDQDTFYDGAKYDDNLLDDIQATESAIIEENRQQQEEQDRVKREQQAELDAEAQIKRLKQEKARLMQQLKEEEQRREKEEDLRRQREEEERERRLQEEERQKEEELRKLEEEKARLQEQLREEARRLREEEKLEQERLEQARIQREEDEKRRQQEEADLRRKHDEEARQAVERHKPALHLERPAPAQEEPPKEGEQPSIDFCDFMRFKPDAASLNAGKDTGFKNPAVVVLGAEDTSADLMWHVISQILYPGRKTARRTHQLEMTAAALDYSLLNKANDNSPTEFWDHISDKSHGKWMVHVFCQQQEHDIAAGFPWVTAADKIVDNQKAKDTLELIRELPKGSLKVIRVKRNSLDVAIRLAQLEQQVGKGNPVQLDQKKIFRQLRKVQYEQDAIDAYLRDNKIPHLALDFDEIFPFNQWTDLVINAQTFQQKSIHINVDWRQLPTQLEATWRDVLRYIDVFTPLSMYDILHFAMQTHEAHAFWQQKDAVAKFPYLERALQGTHYQKLIRKAHPPINFQDELWGDGDEM